MAGIFSTLTSLLAALSPRDADPARQRRLAVYRDLAAAVEQPGTTFGALQKRSRFGQRFHRGPGTASLLVVRPGELEVLWQDGPFRRTRRRVIPLEASTVHAPDRRGWIRVDEGPHHLLFCPDGAADELWETGESRRLHDALRDASGLRIRLRTAS
ncbi:MAG: hypothetical protein AAF533_30295 [Acidobacteriota bacterium]